MDVNLKRLLNGMMRSNRVFPKSRLLSEDDLITPVFFKKNKVK